MTEHKTRKCIRRPSWTHAQLLKISFEGKLLRAVRKSRGLLFSCFIAFLWPNLFKSFYGVHEVPPSPMCIYIHKLTFLFLFRFSSPACRWLTKILWTTWATSSVRNLPDSSTLRWCSRSRRRWRHRPASRPTCRQTSAIFGRRIFFKRFPASSTSTRSLQTFKPNSINNRGSTM